MLVANFLVLTIILGVSLFLLEFKFAFADCSFAFRFHVVFIKDQLRKAVNKPFTTLLSLYHTCPQSFKLSP